MKYYEFKEQVLNKHHENVMKKHGVFWAFSNEQFTKGIEKLNLAEGEKVTEIGGGGYLPTKNVDAFIEDMKTRPTYEGDRKDAIMYELNNHEYKISLDLEQCIDTVLDIMQDNVDESMERKEVEHYAYQKRGEYQAK